MILPKKRIVLVYILSAWVLLWGPLQRDFVRCDRGVRASVVPLTPEVRFWCILSDLDYFDIWTPYGDTLQS